MKPLRPLSGLLLPLSVALLLTGCFKKETEPATTENPATIAKAGKQAPPKKNKAEAKVSFTKSIKPLLSEKCTICHNTQVLPKRPNLETREGAMNSAVIVPGKPHESLILIRISEAHGADKAMPPVSHRLTEQETALLHTWIEQGAEWPAGEAGRIEPAFIPEE